MRAVRETQLGATVTDPDGVGVRCYWAGYFEFYIDGGEGGEGCYGEEVRAELQGAGHG